MVVNVKDHCRETDIAHGYIQFDTCQDSWSLPSVICHYTCYSHYEHDSEPLNCNKVTGNWTTNLNQLCKVATSLQDLWTPKPFSSHVASGSESVYIGVGLAGFVLFSVTLIACYIGLKRKRRHILQLEQSERTICASSTRQREVTPAATRTRNGRLFVIRRVRQIRLLQRTLNRPLAQPIDPLSYQETLPSYETVMNNTSPVLSPNNTQSRIMETSEQIVNNISVPSSTQLPVRDPPPPYECIDNYI